VENDDKIAVEINTMATTKNRKNYQPEFKAKVALEAVRGRLIIFPKQSNAEVSNARRICSLREKRAFSNIFLNSTNAQASPVGRSRKHNEAKGRFHRRQNAIVVLYQFNRQNFSAPSYQNRKKAT
jgi:hypothetical protein